MAQRKFHIRFIFYPGQTFDNLRNVIKHELIHFGQDLLAKAKNSKRAGFPSQKALTNPEIDSTDPEVHGTQDIEFYPVLSDEIVAAKENGKSAQEHIKSSHFFNLLKRKAPEKYKKAVKELIKALS